MKDINTIIAQIEKYGYKVKEYANIEKGKLNEECPVVYKIYDAKTHQTLYGAGTVGPKSLEKWLAWMVERYGEKTDEVSKDVEDVEVETVKADVEKEKEYDRVYNEDGEGYNPYRTGSTPTYWTGERRVGRIDPQDA